MYTTKFPLLSSNKEPTMVYLLLLLFFRMASFVWSEKIIDSLLDLFDQYPHNLQGTLEVCDRQALNKIST